MAINPEKEHKAPVKFTYENLEKPSGLEHEVQWHRHVPPWDEYDQNNYLEPSWKIPPKPRNKGGDKPFPVEKKTVGPGSGEATVEWTVWEESKKLNTHSLELYSVMRAEKYYIARGYTKLASKYVSRWYNKKGGYGGINENVGVDNFFQHKENKSYLFCESKFTGDLDQLKRLKKRNDSGHHENLWKYLSEGKANKKPCRQMSWEWIQDRAKKAVEKPSSLPDPSKFKTSDEYQKACAPARWQRSRMLAAALRENGKRVVNIYGAKEVPIYPGVYKFISDLHGRLSENELHVVWPFEPADDEFIELGSDFDAWVAQQKTSTSSSSASST